MTTEVMERPTRLLKEVSQKKPMKILVIGSGGREDVLVWKIGQSDLVSEIFVAPGNDGIAQRPKTSCLPKLKADNLLGLRDFAKENKIDLTVVGPEAPLVANIVDIFRLWGLRIVGPHQGTARLEGSKVFAKMFMEDYGIPTAPFMVFDDQQRAMQYAIANLPCVIKADGLAAGKGVFPCRTEEEVKTAIKRIMIDKEFKESGNQVVVEDFLVGEEATFMVLTDGYKILPLIPTQDHKPVFDGDRGPNTGGMGAYAPAPVITEELEKEIMETIVKPTIDGMKAEGMPYQGILYVGLMIVNTSDGPKPMVLEFNCRFGDPELQPILMLMESDIVPILMYIADGYLPDMKIKWRKGAAVCVVMTSGGYPGDYEKNKKKVITGLEKVAKMDGIEIFYAAVRREGNLLKTDGGRVLNVVTNGKDIPATIAKVYKGVAEIGWDDEHHRMDIGQKALKHGIPLRIEGI